MEVLPGSLGTTPPTGPSLNLTWVDPLQVFSVESASNVGPGATWTAVSNYNAASTNQVLTLNIPISSNTPNYYRMTWTKAMLPAEETVGVNVIDANGVKVSATQKLGVLAVPIIDTNLVGLVQNIGWGFESPYEPGIGTQDELDWTTGMEFNPVFGSKELGYFSYAAQSLDFLDPPWGDNNDTVDKTDILFYVGHGNPDVFTFTSPFSSDILYFDLPYPVWGNVQQEWMCLLSCSVLAPSDGYNLNAETRWGPAMDGLHILMGFSTEAWAGTGFPTTFTQYMGGKSWMPIASAWFAAAKARGTGTPAVLAPIGPGNVTDLFDDWWGLGPVGPRIMASQIQGFVYAVPLAY
jgi:hypothetical protein